MVTGHMSTVWLVILLVPKRLHKDCCVLTTCKKYLTELSIIVSKAKNLCCGNRHDASIADMCDRYGMF